MNTRRWTRRAADRWPRPQFLPLPPPVAWVWWLAAAAAALGLTVAWTELRDLQLQADVQREAAAQWQRRAVPLRAAPATAGTSRGSSDGSDAKAARDAALRVAASLAYPWPRLVAGIEEGTADGIQWIAFSHSSADAALRLEGEAARTEDALAAVDRLSSQAGWSSVALARIEAPDAKLNGRLRFEIVARLSMADAAKVMP